MTTEPLYLPESGDIIWLDLDPRTGHEQSGRRPCLVLSDIEYSQKTGMSVICPVTSRPKGLPFEIKLIGTKTQDVVLPIHVRSIDLEARHPKFIEKAPQNILIKTRENVMTIIGAA